MSDDDDLDENRPCYGEYKCSRCQRKWNSTKAWKDYAQICANCETIVYPAKLSKNFAYICRECTRFWYSKYSATGKKCENCKSNINIFPLDPDDSEDQKIIKAHHVDVSNENVPKNPNGEHRQDLCLKCKTMGRPCRELIDDRTFKVPIDRSNHFEILEKPAYNNSSKSSKSSSAIKSQVCKEHIYLHVLVLGYIQH